MGPIYNRIHLGLGKSPANPTQNDFIARTLFSGPIVDPKKVLGPKCRPWVRKNRSWAQKSAPGHEKTKDARWKTMKNPVFGIANGAILCKLWPNTILKLPQNIGICFKKGNPVFNKGTLFSKRESCFQQGVHWDSLELIVLTWLHLDSLEPMWFAGFFKTSGTTGTGEQA